MGVPRQFFGNPFEDKPKSEEELVNDLQQKKLALEEKKAAHDPKIVIDMAQVEVENAEEALAAFRAKN